MVEVVETKRGVGYVDWGAIIAGAIAAAALSFVLLTAGAAIGLSLLSPDPSHSYGKSAATLATFWALFVPILCFLVGGYIAGRMRAARESASIDEVEFRDGMHGFLMWALSIVIGGALAFFTAAGAAQVGAQVGSNVLSSRNSAITPIVDSLLRGTAQGTQTGQTPSQAPPGAATRTSTASPASSDLRDDIVRALGAAVADGRLNAADKQYIAQVIAQRTGLPAPEAEKRVDEAFASAQRAVDEARKAAVLAGLVTATAMLIGLAAAWYAARNGGRHRDNNIPAKFSLSPGLSRRRPVAGPGA